MVASALFDSITSLIYRIQNKKTDPSYLKVIPPLLSAYVLCGLITTASDQAVSIYVYIYGFIWMMMVFVSAISIVVHGGSNES